jgi:hypothetical protein
MCMHICVYVPCMCFVRTVHVVYGVLLGASSGLECT